MYNPIHVQFSHNGPIVRTGRSTAAALGRESSSPSSSTRRRTERDGRARPAAATAPPTPMSCPRTSGWSATTKSSASCACVN